MTNKNTNTVSELTPATLENMPVGQKIAAYEQILSDQAQLSEKLIELVKEGNKVLEPAGIQFSGLYLKRDVKVPQKRNVDKILYAFAQRVGRTVSDLLANGSTSETTLEAYLGNEAYAKLKAIANEYSIQGYGSKDIDEKASEKVWLEYTKVRDEHQVVSEQLAKSNRRMEQANQYVGYVQKLAEVASKTRKLMQ